MIFLTEDNIKDDKISIQLMEEICAAVSAQTYIFPRYNVISSRIRYFC